MKTLPQNLPNLPKFIQNLPQMGVVSTSTFVSVEAVTL